MALQLAVGSMVRRDWGRDCGPEYLGTYHGPTPGECVLSCLSWLQVIVATNSPLFGAWIAQYLSSRTTKEIGYCPAPWKERKGKKSFG